MVWAVLDELPSWFLCLLHYSATPARLPVSHTQTLLSFRECRSSFAGQLQGRFWHFSSELDTDLTVTEAEPALSHMSGLHKMMHGQLPGVFEWQQFCFINRRKWCLKGHLDFRNDLALHCWIYNLFPTTDHSKSKNISVFRRNVNGCLAD